MVVVVVQKRRTKCTTGVHSRREARACCARLGAVRPSQRHVRPHCRPSPLIRHHGARLSKKQFVKMHRRRRRAGLPTRHGAHAVAHRERREHSLMAAADGRVVGGRQESQVERAGDGWRLGGQGQCIASTVWSAGNPTASPAAGVQGVGQHLGLFWPWAEQQQQQQRQRLCYRRGRDDAYARGYPHQQSCSIDCPDAPGRLETTTTTAPTTRRRRAREQAPVVLVAVLDRLCHLRQHARPQLERPQLVGRL